MQQNQILRPLTIQPRTDQLHTLLFPLPKGQWFAKQHEKHGAW